MLVSHTVNLDDRRPEATLTSTAPVDTSAIVIEAGIIGSTSRLSASTPTPALSGEREMNPQSPIRAAVLPITSDLANPAAVTWRDNSSEQPLMREPHLSMLYEKDDVMSKHFGVTQKQALRTQALLRLGVTEEDVKIAERLLGSRLDGDCVSADEITSCTSSGQDAVDDVVHDKSSAVFLLFVVCSLQCYSRRGIRFGECTSCGRTTCYGSLFHVGLRVTQPN